MRIKWRLSVIFIQILIAILFNKYLFDNYFIIEGWFLAGLLAFVINPKLIEPWDTSPLDVLVNTLVFFAFYLLIDVSVTDLVWKVVGGILVLSCILALIAIFGGANKKRGERFSLAQPARMISRVASAKFIYTIIFFLSAYETYQAEISIFFQLAVVWIIILGIGSINWQQVWESKEKNTYFCEVEGILGPSLLNVSTQNLPKQGSNILIQLENKYLRGVIVKRIRRLSSLWGQILVLNHDFDDSIVLGDVIRILKSEKKVDAVGTVEENSTETVLKFTSTRSLELGDVVGVKNENDKYILYQVSHVEVKEFSAKTGAHFFALVTAVQLGIFDETNQVLNKHRWIPSLGGAVIYHPEVMINSSIDDSEKFKLGRVVDTSIPIFIDLDVASEGHIAILGMTKMGKSTLAEKIIRELEIKRNVAILDQTGEYVSKKGFDKCTGKTDFDNPGSYVVEPKPSEIPAERGLEFLEFLMGKAIIEYRSKTPNPRTILFEEAHQFIPEPAGLGFGTPGRDSSIQTGILMMQIRKYNLSTIIISQRTAVIAKSALSQCENFIVFRSVDQTGLDYIENVAGFNFRDLVAQLGQGEALVFGPAISSDNPVVISIRYNQS